MGNREFKQSYNELNQVILLFFNIMLGFEVSGARICKNYPVVGFNKSKERFGLRLRGARIRLWCHRERN